MERGYEFESDTDTEVIPKLLRYLYYSQLGEDGPPTFQDLLEQAIMQLVRVACHTGCYKTTCTDGHVLSTMLVVNWPIKSCIARCYKQLNHLKMVVS